MIVLWDNSGFLEAAVIMDAEMGAAEGTFGMETNSVGKLYLPQGQPT